MRQCGGGFGLAELHLFRITFSASPRSSKPSAPEGLTTAPSVRGSPDGERSAPPNPAGFRRWVAPGRGHGGWRPRPPTTYWCPRARSHLRYAGCHARQLCASDQPCPYPQHRRRRPVRRLGRPCPSASPSRPSPPAPPGAPPVPGPSVPPPARSPGVGGAPVDGATGKSGAPPPAAGGGRRVTTAARPSRVTAVGARPAGGRGIQFRLCQSRQAVGRAEGLRACLHQ